jgi:hypothetical protein
VRNTFRNHSDFGFVAFAAGACVVAGKRDEREGKSEGEKEKVLE